jgi:hypothetical protein
MSGMTPKAAALALLVALLPGAGRAAPPGAQQNPDWPCQQRLVPTLSAASLWADAKTEGLGDWHAEPKVAALVEKIAPRDVATEDGVAAIDAFMKGLGEEERARLPALAFQGLVEETNRQRSEIIDRLEDFGERQHNLSALVSRMTAEHDAIPADATGDDAKRKLDLEERLVYTTRAFQGMQSTIRYACDTPGELEARLGAYAHALQAAK